MGRRASIILVATVGLAAAGCATQTHQIARVDEASTLADAPAIQPMAVEETGTEAAAWGDKWTAANLFERSADKDQSVVARFDLASTYEQTGRLPEAAALYRGLIHDGRFVSGTSNIDYHHRGARLVRFNIADESARRLAALERRMALAPSSGMGAVSATEYGAPTAAVVGGPAAAPGGRISDTEAMRLDAVGAP